MTITETERLVISQLELSDAAFIIELVNDPDWIRYIGDRGVKTTDDACTYLNNGPIKSYGLNGFGLFLVKLKEEDIAIGMCGLIKRPGLDDIDIGYAFLPKARGKGYAYESAVAVLEYGKDVLGLKRIVAITTPDNKDSIHLLEKLGMKFEKMIKITDDADETTLFAIDFSRKEAK